MQLAHGAIDASSLGHRVSRFRRERDAGAPSVWMPSPTAAAAVAAISRCLLSGCGHCKRLVPAFTELGVKIAANPKLKNRVLIAKVDADAHRELGE